jgi:serine/threonine-protein kinase
MSPEQLTDTKNVDGRSDIWTLGVILHQLLSGAVPFFGETLPEVVGQILKNAPGKLRDSRADVPEALEQVIQKCMSSNPALRFADVGELVTALAPFAPGSQAHVAAVTRSLGGMSGPPSARNPIGVAPTVSSDRPPPPPTGSALEIDLVRRSDRPAAAGTLSALASTDGSKKARSPLPYVVVALAAATAIGVAAFVLGKGSGAAATTATESVPPATISAPVVPPPSATAPASAAALAPSAVPSVAPAASVVAVTHTASHTTTTTTAKPPPSVATTTHASATATVAATAPATAPTNPMNMGLK